MQPFDEMVLPYAGKNLAGFFPGLNFAKSEEEHHSASAFTTKCFVQRNRKTPNTNTNTNTNTNMNMNMNMKMNMNTNSNTNTNMNINTNVTRKQKGRSCCFDLATSYTLN